MIRPILCCMMAFLFASLSLSAQEGSETKQGEKTEQSVDLSKIDSQFMDLRKISKEGEIWISPREKVVVVGGIICLNAGPLEMFACVPQTKEHESIVVIKGKAYELHAALLAIGAKPGKPAVFAPKYVPASGDEIEVEAHWIDNKGKQRKIRVQEWIKNTKTKKAMTHDFIFGGSGFFHDTISGEKFYMAEGGEVICVSNFGTALLDIPIESSKLNDGLMFEAFTDRIPKVKTPIRLVLKKKEKKEGEKGKEEKKDEEKSKPDEKNKSDETKRGEK